MSRAADGREPSTVISAPEAETYLGLPKGTLASLADQGAGPDRYLHKLGGLRQYESAWLDAWQVRQSSPSRTAPVAIASPAPSPVVPASVPVAPAAVASLPVPIAYALPPAPAPKLDLDDSSKPLEARIEDCWAASADIRAEFGTFAIYEAYRLAEARGAVGILRAAVRPATGHGERQAGSARPDEPSGQSIEDRCAAEWRTNPDLRAEFGDKIEHYVAYRKAEASGQVRVYKSR